MVPEIRHAAVPGPSSVRRGEDPGGAEFTREPRRVLGGRLAVDAYQAQQPGADAGDRLTIDINTGRGDALNDGAHGSGWRKNARPAEPGEGGRGGEGTDERNGSAERRYGRRHPRKSGEVPSQLPTPGGASLARKEDHWYFQNVNREKNDVLGGSICRHVK